MESIDCNDFLSCAIRETKEEFFSSQSNLYPSFAIVPEAKSRLIIPLIFEFHTYFYDMTDTDIQFNHNWEFSKVEWFNTNKLPHKTHIGVRQALLFLK